jgi:hypothetical protein
MLSNVVGSKKKVKETKSHLKVSLDDIAHDNEELIKINYKIRILKTIETVNNQIYRITQKIEKGLFHEALLIYEKAEKRFESLDQQVRNTKILLEIEGNLKSKRTEIHQLCVYFLVNQIFSKDNLKMTAETGPTEDFSAVFNSEVDANTGFAQGLKGFGLNFADLINRTFGNKRMRFLYSSVLPLKDFQPERYMEYIDLNKLDKYLGNMPLIRCDVRQRVGEDLRPLVELELADDPSRQRVQLF